MKSPEIPKSKPQPFNRKSLTKPSSKPINPISKPRVNLKSKSEPYYEEFQFEIRALKDENLKLCRQIAKLKAENVTLKSQITIITEEYSQYCHDNPPFDPSRMTEETREALDGYMKQLLEKQIPKS